MYVIDRVFESGGRRIPASTILQLHYLGEQEENMAVEMLQPAVARQQSVNLILVPDVDHGFFWGRLWTEVMTQLPP